MIMCYYKKRRGKTTIKDRLVKEKIADLMMFFYVKFYIN